MLEDPIINFRVRNTQSEILTFSEFCTSRNPPCKMWLAAQGAFEVVITSYMVLNRLEEFSQDVEEHGDIHDLQRLRDFRYPTLVIHPELPQSNQDVVLRTDTRQKTGCVASMGHCLQQLGDLIKLYGVIRR